MDVTSTRVQFSEAQRLESNMNKRKKHCGSAESAIRLKGKCYRIRVWVNGR
jgi:hypothetical protein